MSVMPHRRIINSLVSENEFSAYGALVPEKAFFVGSLPASSGLLVKTTAFSFLTSVLLLKRPLDFMPTSV